MSSTAAFPIENFEDYCNNLKRVGIDPGYVMYTNQHASNDQPAARLISGQQLEAALAYIESPTEEAFVHLVRLGAMFDTEWDRNTQHWQIISFAGWDVLHKAFNHLHAKSGHALMELTGLSDFP